MADKIFIAMWESRDYLYQGFAHSRFEAIDAVVQGYRKMCKSVSGTYPSKHDIGVLQGEISVTEMQIDKCLIDAGRQGWL